MSMQTSADSAAGAPLWACALVKLAPTSTNRTNLFEDNTVDYIMGDDPFDVDEKLEMIQLEIDQMLDMEEPYDKVHAYVSSQNAIYGDVFDLPDKKLFDAGKYKSYVDLMSLSNV